MPIQAQSNSKWTLNYCMKYAVENNPRKHKTKAQAEIYKQSYFAAIGQLLPQIGLNSNASLNFGRNLGSQNTYTEVNTLNNYYNLNSTLLLFDGLLTINKVRMQRMNHIMGKQSLENECDMIAYETMQAYFTVLYNQELIALREQQLAQSEETLQQVKRMEELGVKSFADVAEAQAQQALHNYNLTRQKNILAISVIKLKEIMNLPIGEELNIADYGSDELIVKTLEAPSDIYNQSLSFLPQALATLSSAKVQELAYKSAKGSIYPIISLQAGINTASYKHLDNNDVPSFKDQFNGNMGRYIGVNISVPIFQGFANITRIRQSRQQMIIARNNMTETLRTLYADIEQAVADMNGEVDEYNQAQKKTEAMRIADQVNQKKYMEGLISPIDFHTSNNRLLQAKADELNARLLYHLKKRLVDYYKGIPYITE